jgi:tRNA U34 5-methylaminomethyl-2-thiouridine-forming methyltransferase MnmC
MQEFVFSLGMTFVETSRKNPSKKEKSFRQSSFHYCTIGIYPVNTNKLTEERDWHAH